MALINCLECNAQISDKAKSCPKCGAPIVIKETIKCFECGTELDKETKVCSNCGAEQEVIQEENKGIKEEQRKEATTKSVGLPAPPNKKNKGLIWTLISVGILVLIVVIALAIKNQNKNYSSPEPPREKTPEELRQELFDKERQNPLKYLTATCQLNSKVYLFKETEYKLTVTIYNSSTMATFKDVVFEVQFLTKTDALLGSKSDTLYDIISPKGSKSKTIGVVFPNDATKYAVKIISCK
jgi:hypothetical protein